MHLTSILPLKFKRADYCPIDQFDQKPLRSLLQFHTRHFQQCAIPEKIQTWVKGSVYGISNPGILKKGQHKNPRIQLRSKWNFWGFQRKTDVKFPWVLVFDHGISNFKIVAHNFAEFLGLKKLVFSRISKVNATNLKFPEGGFRKVYLPLRPPTGLKVFWNSPIMDR